MNRVVVFALKQRVSVIIMLVSLLAVGIGTSGGSERPLHRRIAYVVAVVMVGVIIVLLEASVHLA